MINEDQQNSTDLDINAWQIHITHPLTSEKIIELMDNYPSLRRITCSQSLYDNISPKYLEALNSLDIKVEVEYNWGRKRVHPQEDIDKVLDSLKEGNSPKSVSEQFNIPLNRVYYFRSKYSTDSKKDYNFYKRKYDDKLRLKIKNLVKNGEKPKNISKDFNIPLRSVYNILNDK